MILCFCSLIVEGVISTAPFVLLFLILLYIYTRKDSVFIYAFISGLFLDIFQVRVLGETALFFLPVLFLLFLYQRKFEIASLPFVIFSVFISSYCYLFFFIQVDILLQTIFITILGAIIFLLLERMGQRVNHQKRVHAHNTIYSL